MRKELSTSQANEISITKILLLIISTFLLCNLLALVLNFREAFAKVRSSNELIVLSAFFVTINSAVNFLIYCVFGKKFRQVCREVWIVKMILGCCNCSGAERNKKKNASSQTHCTSMTGASVSTEQVSTSSLAP